MKLDHIESKALAVALKAHAAQHPIPAGYEVVLCPSFDSLPIVAAAIEGSGMAVGAQDVYWQEKGAFTGEVSASMVRAHGCKYVIVGHSERRKYLRETDEMINGKVKAVLDAGMTPILCVGETYEERHENMTELVIMRQVIEALKGIPLKSSDSIVIAYEPVWVIGTGQAIDPTMAEIAARVIHQSLVDLLPVDVVMRQTRTIYGGSVDASNIASYVAVPLMSGALVGSASLVADTFINLLSTVYAHHATPITR